MYDTSMLDPATLALLDDALIRMRRLWSGPTSRPVDEDSWPGVELSTILVADALHRVAAGRPGGEVTVADIAARLDVAHSTASRLVDRAVRAGAVLRRRSTRDGRRAALGLTASGQQLVTEARAHRRQLLQGVLRGWPARDVTALAQLLDRLAEAVQAQAPHTSQGGEP